MKRTNFKNMHGFEYIEKHDEMKLKIIHSCYYGKTFEQACKEVDINDATGRRWKQRDEDFRRNVIYAKFLFREIPKFEILKQRIERRFNKIDQRRSA